MSSVIDRIKKRAFYPFKMVNGETVHLKALTIGQLQSIEAFGSEHSANGYAIGHSLMDESGSVVFTQLAEESCRDFGTRVLSEIDMPLDVFHPIVEFIFKLSTTPSEHATEAIIKN